CTEATRMRTRPIAWALACALALPAALPALAAASGSASVSAASSGQLGDRVLSVGTSGDDVRALQQLLIKRGFHLSADGQFGPQTLAAVKRAQSAYGLTVDGLVGPATIRALRGGSPHKSGHKSGRC